MTVDVNTGWVMSRTWANAIKVSFESIFSVETMCKEIWSVVDLRNESKVLKRLLKQLRDVKKLYRKKEEGYRKDVRSMLSALEQVWLVMIQSFGFFTNIDYWVCDEDRNSDRPAKWWSAWSGAACCSWDLVVWMDINGTMGEWGCIAGCWWLSLARLSGCW